MSRITPTLATAVSAIVFALGGAPTATATSEPPAGTTVDCSAAGEPVEFDDPSVLVGEAPVFWLTLDDENLSTVAYEMDTAAGQIVAEVASTFGGTADIVVSRDGAPFAELTGIPAGRQCILDVDFQVGRYEWRIAGTDQHGAFGVPHRVDCSDSPAGDPWATTSAGLRVVVDVGDDEIGVAAGEALVAGAATIAVHAVEATSGDARVAIERDRDDFAVFADLPPGGVCTLDVELPAGDYEVSTDLHGNVVDATVWPVPVLDLSRLAGGADPVRLGLDAASAGSYTDACDVFTDDVLLAAIPGELGATTVAADAPAAAADGWLVTCEWLITTAADGELAVGLTLPGVAADAAGAAAFDDQRAGHAAEPGFVDLGVIAEGCYATAADDIATARCPYGPSEVSVSITGPGAGGPDTGGPDAPGLAGAAVSLLDNLWNRPAN